MTLGSLFDGSGTAPLAATILGGTPLWASEIEPYPIAVTKARFPNTKHLGDITKISGAEIDPVDVIVGGSPCQDLSIAGKQAGLESGTRSNLFYEMTRIIREMRSATNGKYPRFVVWENVPGAFSSNKGDDFYAVIKAFCALADDTISIPAPQANRKTGRLTWKNAGAVVGDGWSFAWRVLDAQFWGVPQRRRRIFAVLDLGSECAGEILFERTRLPRDSESRGAEGEGTPADAVGRADRGGGVRCLNPYDAQTMRVYDANGIYPALFANTGGGQNRQAVIYEPMSLKEENWAEADAKNTLRANASKSAHVIVQDAVYALQGNGIDRSVGAVCNGAGWREGEMYTLNTIDRPAVAYGVDCRNGALNEDLSPTMQAKPGGGQSPNCMPPVIYDARGNGDGEVAATLTGDHQNRVTDYTNIAVEKRRRYIVRRLTPLECTRLQGFPDWWTDGISVPNPTEDDIEFWTDVWETHRKVMNPEGKPKTRKQIVTRLRDPGSDSNEYKMWGNGMALPCMLAVLSGIKEVVR